MDDMAYAGFLRRFGAFWIDFLFLLPVMALAYLLGEYSRLYQLYWLLPGLLFGLWYSVYLVVRYGGTPGKLILNMRIAMVDGSPVTPKAAFLRYAVLLVLSEVQSIALIMAAFRMTDEEYFSLDFIARTNAMLELAPPWLQVVDALMQVWIWSEFITMLFNKKRRAVHDFMAGTVVLNGRQPNHSMQPTGYFLRLSGHPELTLQECSEMPRPGPRTTYKYSDRFKATAVRLSQLPGVAVQDVAESLYIHPFMLSRWRKQAREGLIVTKGIAIDKETAAELKALRAMQRDYERLKLEHEILKKAIAFTSEQKATSSPSSSTARRSSR